MCQLRGYSGIIVTGHNARSSSAPSVPSAFNGFNSRDQLTSDTYDPNGNTTLSVGVTMQDTYDFEGRNGVRPWGLGFARVKTN